MSAEAVGTSSPAPLPVDARVTIKVSDDKLSATAVFYPPENGGKDVDWSDVNKEIEKYSIKYGVNKDLIQSHITNKIYNVELRLAEGVPPQHGTDAVLEYLFDRDKTGLPKILEDGTVDFRTLDRMTVVEARAPLLKLTPHTDGVPGTSVMNVVIAQKRGKPRYIVPGKNTLLSPDGRTLFAEISGEVREYNGRVSVSDVTEITSDVGVDTGNITFSGNIRIAGGVSSGFRVVSTNGSIEVMGVAEGAYLEAEGNVVLRGGMKGGDRGEIISKGNIVSKFFEGCKVHATGDISCEVVMNSDVSCRGTLDVSRGKGLIVGRTVRAGVEIHGRVIGSRSSVQTQLEVGIDPVSLERFKTVKKEITDQQELMEKLSKSMDFLVKLKVAGKLGAEQAGSMSNVLRSMKAVKERLFDLNHELEELTPLVEDIGKGRVRVSGVVYPGTKLAIGRAAYIVANEMQYCTFVREGGEVKLAPYF